MKRIVTLAAVAALTLPFAACGGFDTADLACRDLGSTHNPQHERIHKDEDGLETYCENGRQVENTDADGLGWQAD